MSALISPLSIAPMIDWTYTHFRVFMRLIAPRALLYTDMQTTGAVINNPSRALTFDSIEHPLALQLGGSDKAKLVECARLAENQGFDEINLNLGCPSDKVQAGRFGACLMNEPDQVAACIHAIKSAVSIPVTAKTRIGIDNQDSYEFFANFAHKLVDAGCDKLIVHARKAWLSGLNPKQNRTIPPVNYEFVYKIKQELPQLPVVINGNIDDITGIEQHMLFVDGVMLGRLACNNPYALAAIHHYYYPEIPIPARHEILQHYVQYIESKFSQGIALTILLKPLFNFAHGLSGAKRWKEQLMKIQQSKKIEMLKDTVDLFSVVEPIS
ncbi:tRNA-dihydrouridine synthase A [Legionella hackeliae]|uniref:tRNA-dihydrouridine(20/20a) synthase n=1 Tax=Legionella hackeliae TaxID=449 RepID=A0A0A8UPP2_LEGHA|nr:tRNA-dihydrouridine synthase A [Legionella hackeliae]CEK10703.1 tRNA-dihydrouridine synthase A [Legionella hackeliae]STX47451.1 tRNA-dihydrouridine synthase A [Legionella hackeliae]